MKFWTPQPRTNPQQSQKSYLRGKQYEVEKLSQGGTGANQHTKGQTGQNVQSAKPNREVKDGTAGRIGKQYEAQKQTNGGNRGNQHTKQAGGQNDDLPDGAKTRDIIAKEHGVNGRTIRRDADFARGIDSAACAT